MRRLPARAISRTMAAVQALLPIVRFARGHLARVCLAAAVAMSLSSAPARADEDERMVGIIYGTLVLVDASFAAYDIAAAVDNRPVTSEVAVPQIILGLPQYVAANVAFAFTQIDDSPFAPELRDAPALPLVMLPLAAMSTAMTFHGLVSVFDPDGEQVQPSNLGIVSTLVGVNLPFTAAGLAAGVTGRWPSPVVVVPQIGFGAASTAASLVQAARAQPHDRAGWGLAAGWSIATVAHGALSLALHEEPEDTGDWASRQHGPQKWSLVPMLDRAARPKPRGVMLAARF